MSAGDLALAATLLLLVLAPRWPFLLMAVPVPAMLTGRLSRDPRAAGCAHAVAGLVGVGALVVGGHPVGLWVTGGVLAVFAVVLPWLLGLYLRSTSALERAGWERARTLERELRLRTERTRMRERSRIARDLHDAMGHQLSLLALGAGAMETAPDLPEERRAQAGQLREAAGRAAEQLMVAVGVLRTDADPAPLAPTGDGLTRLVDDAREAGLRVTLEERGPLVDLPLMVDRALYRVVQEALTNVAKHAPDTESRVELHGGSGSVGVRVCNPLPREWGDRRPAPGAGSGLVGLRERVHLAGGALTAGPDNGYWVVVAQLPTREPGPAQDAQATGGAEGDRAVQGASATVGHPAGTSAGVFGPGPGPGSGHRTSSGSGSGSGGGGRYQGADGRRRSCDGSRRGGHDPGGNRKPRDADSCGLRARTAVDRGADDEVPGVDEIPGEIEEHPQRRVRRRTLWAISTIVTVPILAAMVGYGLLLGMSTHEAASSTLDPGVYDGLRVGQDRAEVEALLPPRELNPGAVTAAYWPEEPEGLDCRHYRSSADVLSGEFDSYRLCFDSLRLVSAEVLP
ncbi:sensor histidine kinase [Nocardiopsis sp. NPDC006938]|uniref:sensor histidine kinase n=1 Tax=Nocardiopsis sp. NPDC006938 TaxID=3364337 RepID=UPI003684BA9E